MNKTETVNPTNGLNFDKIKKHMKYIGIILINVGLAYAAVYLLEFWVRKVIELDALHIAENLAIAVLTPITYFIGQTYYTKGTTNVLKKIITLILLSAAIVGLMLTASLNSSFVYPLSGVIVASVSYYMLSLSASTLGSLGMVGFGVISTFAISFGLLFDKIEWGTAGILAKLAVFGILFWGGVVPHIRNYAHGIKGINKDGGGFGGGAGDANDGDGDTGDE